ncbi:unnamed protein product [Didymodactylos carnosus]|uniref:Bardet-Biedl syndrome 1 n=1 Tax=Didymodactylos carnosus TaxID=1234261 RepID=A0A813SMK7_9BILA|nr:unnamed protein product [Didymodactylos carnosus]CAF0962011.1 unnamed protein product [Didymodactylos carnosus]CAF3587026.1 unnamed protein product [Didymodactylos carnosus]CAF3734688.1 unnamed protein product [Didymodactylos carnosus]
MRLNKERGTSSKQSSQPDQPNSSVQPENAETKATTTDSKSQWLSAHNDFVAGLNTVSSCMELSDLWGDGSINLILADYGNILLPKLQVKLKVFKGFTVAKESNLTDLPCAVVACFMDNLQPRVPALAVASGSAVFVFKSLRPYYKFTLPQLEIHEVEKEVWAKAKEGNIDVRAMNGVLNELNRSNTVPLTYKSLMFLRLASRDEALQFVEAFKNTELKRQSSITCMKKLNKTSADEDALSCLVVGTEDAKIYIIESEAFTILATMKCPSPPAYLNVSGGKRYWKHSLPSIITAMCLIDYRPKAFQAVAVALGNNEIHLYKDKFLVDVIQVDDVVHAMRFGRFGREDGTLIMITKNGGLIVKILKRTATFEDTDVLHGPPKEQNMKIDVPKRTKLYVDQTLREKELAETMYRVFQQDLIRLKFLAGKEFLKSIQSGLTPVAKTKTETIRINAEIPILVNGMEYGFCTFVSCITDKVISDTVKVLVCRRDTNTPLLSAVINMPVAEPILNV